LETAQALADKHGYIVLQKVGFIGQMKYFVYCNLLFTFADNG
jgi:hypothetical protein